jgi:catechol 2,3-dioxygenase-like lactoylglutathione lyase family enzyme
MDQAAVQVTGLDHVVLLVEDTERTLAWYCGELGLAGERVEEWRAGKVFFPSVRIDATTLIDVLPRAPGAGRAPESERNVDHVCLVIEPTDMQTLAASGRFTVVDGPDTRWGAQGDATSLYVLDPDGNVVELRHY